MGRFYIKKDGTIYVPKDAQNCRYRGRSVCCSLSDIESGKCATCGWNPTIENKRKNQPAKR